MDINNLMKNHKNFMDSLINQFGVKSLSSDEIDILDEPIKTWFLWGASGFDRAEETFKLLSKFKNDSKYPRHLDIGCGPGYLSTVFALNDYESVGVDLADLSHANCNKMDYPNIKLNFYNMDCTSKEMFDLGKFDIITIDNVIEHVESPSILISHLKHLLNKDGIIYLIIPNSHSIDLVKSDPHYKLFGLSLLDKKDGDAMVMNLTEQKAYEVNNWYYKYDISNYTTIFSQFGFNALLYDDHSLRINEWRKHLFYTFDIDSTKKYFNDELYKLKNKLPTFIFDKLKYIINIYISELANNFEYGYLNKDEEFILNSFIPKYFLSSWFFILKIH